MDRSLKWRTVALVGAVLFCLGILAPSFLPKKSLPKWFANCAPGEFCLVKSKIQLGLDLQGGLHIVYSIDLDKAIDDYASEIKRNVEARFKDESIKGLV